MHRHFGLTLKYIKHYSFFKKNGDASINTHLRFTNKARDLLLQIICTFHVYLFSITVIENIFKI